MENKGKNTKTKNTFRSPEKSSNVKIILDRKIKGIDKYNSTVRDVSLFMNDIITQINIYKKYEFKEITATP